MRLTAALFLLLVWAAPAGAQQDLLNQQAQPPSGQTLLKGLYGNKNQTSPFGHQPSRETREQHDHYLHHPQASQPATDGTTHAGGDD